ncbi:hypothetical protein AX774_g1274 [Zancudomyces culisetae]|uniref:Uncharacterized protein n=1 Tax=Zancudomyces culisetae TaxID=1213189 RepID=A0A1R1PW87_ZANCU|nr:hypothetical protein AX774_g1274 [Zancudomyces culisetae]|eukprot:OMH85173.1 hypothetical protein AX774_g1274 [Zancudomyces culisetae]
MQNRSSVANSLPPRSLAIVPIISCSRKLHPTPPTTNTSLLPTCAIARSVISTNIANNVSCKEKHRSSALYFPSLNNFSTVVRIPENDTSIPLTV